jgi:hypothetical protein
MNTDTRRRRLRSSFQYVPGDLGIVRATLDSNAGATILVGHSYGISTCNVAACPFACPIAIPYPQLDPTDESSIGPRSDLTDRFSDSPLTPGFWRPPLET